MGNRTYTRNVLDEAPGSDPYDNRSERYGYDNLNRLTVMDRGVLNVAGTAVETPLDHPVLNSNQQWADLDRRGNWLDYRWASVQGGQATTYQQTREANGVNEYPSIDPDGPDPQGGPPNAAPVSLTYDAAGNLTLNPLAPNVGPSAPAGQWYGYDEENRVTAVYRTNGTPEHGDDTLLAEYEYDALGRRVHTTEYIDPATGDTLATPRKTRHVYVGIETVEEYQITGNPGSETQTLLREFLWGDPGRFPEPVAMVTHGGAGNCVPGEPGGPCVFHYLHDVLGSVVGLADSTGVLVERYTYDPYGRTLVETSDGQGGWTANLCGGSAGASPSLCYSAFGNPWLWTGQRYDAGTGLYSFLFRAYSPSLGRWLQRDPIGYAGGSINLHEYVAGMPLYWVDPLGLDPHWHHYFPQEIFRGLIEGLDIDAPEYGLLVEGNDHIGKGGLHSEKWNAEWKNRVTERMKTGELTKDWAIGQLEEMKKLDKFKDVISKGKPATGRYKGSKKGPGTFGKLCKAAGSKAKTGAAALGLIGFIGAGIALIDTIGGDDEEGGGRNECGKFTDQLAQGIVSNSQCEDCAMLISEKTGQDAQGLLFSSSVCAKLPPDGRYPIVPPPPQPPVPGDGDKPPASPGGSNANQERCPRQARGVGH